MKIESKGKKITITSDDDLSALKFFATVAGTSSNAAKLLEKKENEINPKKNNEYEQTK